MAIDYLAQLVDDYTDGVVDLEGTLNRLQFLDWAENKKPLPEDYQRTPRDPADILVENERTEELQRAVVELREELSPVNWQILVLIANGCSMERIGKKLGITHQAVSKRLGTIRRAASGLREYLKQDPPIYEAGSPKVKVTYPMDAARNNHRHCEIPAYLAECFGDTKTLCCYCERCTRKSENKE